MNSTPDISKCLACTGNLNLYAPETGDFTIRKPTGPESIPEHVAKQLCARECAACGYYDMAE